MTDSTRDPTNGDDTTNTEMPKHVFLSAEHFNFKSIILELETFQNLISNMTNIHTVKTDYLNSFILNSGGSPSSKPMFPINISFILMATKHIHTINGKK